jgi:acetyl esterase
MRSRLAILLAAVASIGVGAVGVFALRHFHPPRPTALELRERINKNAPFFGPVVVQMAATKDFAVPFAGREIPVRVYVPRVDEPLPVVVFVHGGGFIAGSIASHEGLTTKLAQRADVIVVSVGYSLAPEAKWPAARDECLAVVQWMREHAAKEFGAKPGPIALSGDSAGAAYCAQMLFIAREQRLPLAGAVLFVPVVDMTAATVTHAGTRQMIEWFVADTFPADVLRTDPAISPLFEPDFTGLAPVMLVLGDGDAWHTEQLAFAGKLASARADATTFVDKGVGHAVTDAGIDAAAAWLNARLRTPAPE